MAKVTLPPDRYIYPRPALLLGTNVNDKPNFMAVGGGGVVSAKPPMFGIPIQHRHHTLIGIRQNMTFSVNIPSVDLVKELDYCGIVSGRNADKVADCGFELFYGTLETAPMIEQCPLNHECRVLHILSTESQPFIVGQIEGSYVSEDCVSGDKPDAEKIRPIILNREAAVYLTFGETIAKTYNVGKELKKGR